MEIVISYVPMLGFELAEKLKLAGKIQIELPEQLVQVKELVDAKMGRYGVQGIAWSWNPAQSETGATLILSKASQVFKHLNEWAENHPEEWFTFFWEMHGKGGYSAGIFPRLDKSYQRYKKAAGLPDGGQATCIFGYLGQQVKLSGHLEESRLQGQDFIDVSFFPAEKDKSLLFSGKYGNLPTIRVPCRRFRDLTTSERNGFAGTLGFLQDQ